MILADYFYPDPSLGWDLAVQCGVEHAVIRLPETADFDVANASHWQTVYDRFTSRGITPVVVEPMPNALHDHIKAGDEKRDWAIEKAIQMLPIMDKLNVRTICFNFMAHVGWTRTSKTLPERGGAMVTGFDLKDYTPSDAVITAEQLWDNYTYFLKAILPHAEKHGIKLALHPDDPPLPKLGNVSRIMISFENIHKAVTMIPSPMLGVTMCQSCYKIMGEDVEKAARAFGDKIFFVHFRNTEGCPVKFRETFHDNGSIDMARMIRVYEEICPDVPVRVDHVPTLNGENPLAAGYGDLGKLFAIGYLKGLLQMANTK